MALLRRGMALVALLLIASGMVGVEAFRVLDRLFPFPVERLERPAARIVEDRDGRPLRLFLPEDEIWRIPVELEELPARAPAALVASEDRRFWLHFGVDPLALARAALDNLRAGRIVSGGSTIPMQIARMAEPRPRTLRSKAIEAFRALQLEGIYTKRELLEIWLELAPYGGNLEGIGAAARFYFGKEPAALSAGEIALLTALPRSPSRYHPVRNPETARRVRAAVLRRLHRRGVVDDDELEAGLRQPLPERLAPVPMEAPHLSRELVRRWPDGEKPLRTTVDRRLQRIAEEAVRRRIPELRGEGIGNAAAVVVEIEGRALRGLVGSAGFLEEGRDGQVNGATARRSPGSTLKPFLYGLAFDAGKLLPDSRVLDVPTDYSGYVAENYDGRYRGWVTVREALGESLNGPAVRLLSEIGLTEFVRFLRRGGLHTLDREPATYGLPLILGAGEVTLLDLTNLYAALADGGRYLPVRMLRKATEGDAGAGEALLSPGAARLVTEILADVRRPDLPDAWNLTRGVPAVAWKTGTSYGHRDAWAVGFSRRFAVGVWVGNFDGTPRKGISGARHAGPLLFDLIRRLETGSGEPGSGGAGPGSQGRAAERAGVRTAAHPEARRRTRRAAIVERQVCAVSRQRPGLYCPATLAVPHLADRTVLPVCEVHRRVFVDAETGTVLTGRCLAERPHVPRILEVRPPELVAWRRGSGRDVEVQPQPAGGCGLAASGEPPRIVSPDPATPYRLRRDVPAEHQKIPLVARTDAASPEGGRLYWYLDGELVTAAPGGREAFVLPGRGRHRLVVVDESGRSDAVTFRVEGHASARSD